MRMKKHFTYIIIFLLFIQINLIFGSDRIFSIPFQKLGNLIIVKAKINGTIENFIFDTGAKKLVVNQKYLTIPESTKQLFEVRGINSKILNARDIKINNFQMGEISCSNITGILLELDLLEKIINQPLYGLIGYEVFKNYDIFIDYKQCEITFIPPEKFMNF